MSAGVIDFDRIAAAVLAASESLVPQWLPGGRRENVEWKARNPTRADANIGSFSVNLHSGIWKDFATGDGGADLVSLYAYVFGMGQGDAARALAEQLGIDAGRAAGRPQPAFGEPSGARSRVNQVWLAIVPVPPGVPAFALSHPHYGRPSRSWAYRTLDGALIGHVCRFDKADGGKEIMPAAWARNSDSGEYAWRWLSFPKPRPLYNLPALAAKPAAAVLLVEGEKAADAAAGLFPQFAVLTWPGGAQAIKHADWSVLAARKVMIWPDADAPGEAAALGIAKLLDKHAAGVRLVRPPDGVPEGWDLADAVQADGWDEARAAFFLKANLRDPKELSTPDKAAPAAGSRGRLGVLDDWRGQLLWGKRDLVDCRENVYLILRHHPAWAGVLGLDEFSKRIVKRKPAPWGAAGDWDQVDDLRLGLWLAQQQDLQLLVRSENNLTAGVNMAAAELPFHPVRDYLAALHWDGVERIAYILAEYFDAPVGRGHHSEEYLALVARFWLVGMVARIYDPGCIMRMMVILEGGQDRGKSTALRYLAQPWFSDTPFVLGDKDAYQVIQGVWLYEIAELDSFSKSESTRIKAFISSTSDNFRAPYERRNRHHPRQTVFAGTTNSDEYLKDATGNTRFAPVRCGDDIRFDALAEVRDQIFAEAVVLYRQGARRYPTREESQRLFRPEQEQREIADPWTEMVSAWLAKITLTQVTLTDVLHDCLEIKADRIDNAKQMSTRIGIAMRENGWLKRRQTNGTRSYYWERPATDTAALINRQAAQAGDEHVPF